MEDTSKANGDHTELSLEDDLQALERVRELELELAQTKLAHVEAECRNQVTHKNTKSFLIYSSLLFKRILHISYVPPSWN